ncbi:MAG: DUF3667 domain-containing protein [Sphingobium sp.]
MSGDVEAAGDAITGAMLARAVEPSHGEAAGAAHGPCLNCGAGLAGPYCAQCGQTAHIHRSFAAIGHELAHGVLHLEGKIFRTLPEPALRPGKLTRRYIDGERAKFVTPFALFLFSAFLMYAVFSLTSHAGPDHTTNIRVNDEAVAELAQEVEQADAAVAKAKAALKRPGQTVAERAARQETLDDAVSERNGLGVATNITTAVRSAGAEGGMPAAIGKALKSATENPEFAYYKLKANAYKFSWALILISVPFVWLLFPLRRDVKVYDHAIYVTYSIAFMSLLFSLSMLLVAAGVTWGLVPFALTLFAAWHMYRQMKDAYRLSRRGALLRLPLLYLFAALALTLFFTMIALIG